MGLAVLGYVIICMVAAIVTVALLIGLRFGGTDLQPAPPYAWLFVLIILAGGWYWVYGIAPFELVMK